MRRSLVTLLLVVYGMGTLFLPMGDFSYLHYLPQMYQQCAGEDPDINAADFVFEHLLNLPVTDDQDGGEHERPHQPFHVQGVSQVVVTISKPVLFECRPPFTPIVITSYPLFNDQDIPSAFLAQVFRPPIV